VLKGSADFSAKGSRVMRFAFLFRFIARASEWGEKGQEQRDLWQVQKTTERRKNILSQDLG
jgi:hypothetical protein